MTRYSFQRDGLTLSYLDSGGTTPAIIALHAHWMEGVTFGLSPDCWALIGV